MTDWAAAPEEVAAAPIAAAAVSLATRASKDTSVIACTAAGKATSSPCWPILAIPLAMALAARDGAPKKFAWPYADRCSSSRGGESASPTWPSVSCRSWPTSLATRRAFRPLVATMLGDGGFCCTGSQFLEVLLCTSNSSTSITKSAGTI